MATYYWNFLISGRSYRESAWVLGSWAQEAGLLLMSAAMIAEAR